jgi:hypothetical protein
VPNVAPQLVGPADDPDLADVFGGERHVSEGATARGVGLFASEPPLSS